MYPPMNDTWRARLTGVWMALAAMTAGGLIVAGCEAQATFQSGTPKAGDRQGDRCFNGTFWVTCPPPATAESMAVEYVTRTWHMAYLEGDNGYPGVRVDVIDASGVCLYVTRMWAEPAVVQTAVISKKDLPAGKGCQ